MKRGHFHPSRCKVCGIGRAEGVKVSQTGLCPEHGYENMIDNLLSLQTKRGPRFRHWRAQLAASVGGALLDDVREQA